MSESLDTPAERLRWARTKAGLESKDFASAMQVNPTTYRAYENGQNGFAKLAGRFAQRLNVSAEWLLEGGPIPPDVDGQDAAPVGTSLAAPINAEVLARLLHALGPSLPKNGLPESAARSLSVALIHGLELLSETGANDPTDREIAMAARAAMSRYREASRT